MQNKEDNLILFPKWKENLQKEGFLALKEKRYTEALPKLNQLLAFNVNNHEIMTGKIICLMELGQYEEAQILCEKLLSYKDGNYYQYMHIYLTLLFQTNQFDILLDQVDIELAEKKVPAIIAEQFQQLYQMSKQMKSDLMSERTVEYIEELTDAIQSQNHVRQWQLIENLRKMKVDPIKTITMYLKDDSIHPLVKTAIFKWLQDKNIDDPIHVCKLNLQLTVQPVEVKDIRSHAFTKQVMFQINEIEQENPTLFILLEQLFYRYAYVRYPIMPPNAHIDDISEALKVIGNEYLQMTNNVEVDPKVDQYIKEIKMCEHLYLSIIEE